MTLFRYDRVAGHVLDIVGEYSVLREAPCPIPRCASAVHSRLPHAMPRGTSGRRRRAEAGTAGATLPLSSAIPLVCSNAGQDYWRTIGEFRDKG